MQAINSLDLLKNKIKDGYEISKEECLELISKALENEDFFERLCSVSNEIRLHFCGNKFDLCTIINGKSGRCSEDCKYCAQSAHYPTEAEVYPLLDTQTLMDNANYNNDKGVLRFSVVTSGRTLTNEEVQNLCESYKTINDNVNISLCASHGLLSYEQFLKLKESGVARYHNNLETSRRNFPNICTTHTYDDKIAAIKAAQKSGLAVCSGGILGLGETMQDRVDMAFDLKSIGIQSIPINILNPIINTPFENNPIVSYKEVLIVIAIYRLILPTAAIRLAGGRGLLDDKGKKAFLSGANAAITGDMLTTQGISINDDLSMLSKLGFSIEKL